MKGRTNEGNSGSNYPQDGGEELKFNNYERHEKKEIVSEEEKKRRLSLVYVTSPGLQVCAHKAFSRAFFKVISPSRYRKVKCLPPLKDYKITTNSYDLGFGI